MKDYYAILGVEDSANEEQIKSAFRKRAMEYHPDRNKAPDAHQKFVEITEAYEVLRDPNKRSRYDQMRRLGATQQAYEQSQRRDQSFYQWQQQARTRGSEYADMSYEEFNEAMMKAFAQMGAQAVYEVKLGCLRWVWIIAGALLGLAALVMWRRNPILALVCIGFSAYFLIKASSAKSQSKMHFHYRKGP